VNCQCRLFEKNQKSKNCQCRLLEKNQKSKNCQCRLFEKIKNQRTASAGYLKKNQKLKELPVPVI